MTDKCEKCLSEVPEKEGGYTDYDVLLCNSCWDVWEAEAKAVGKTTTFATKAAEKS